MVNAYTQVFYCVLIINMVFENFEVYGDGILTFMATSIDSAFLGSHKAFDQYTNSQ